MNDLAKQLLENDGVPPQQGVTLTPEEIEMLDGVADRYLWRAYEALQDSGFLGDEFESKVEAETMKRLAAAGFDENHPEYDNKYDEIYDQVFDEVSDASQELSPRDAAIADYLCNKLRSYFA